MASHRYARALIDLQAFRSNLALAKRCAGGRAVYAVVKADAYGHGAINLVNEATDIPDLSMATNNYRHVS